MLIAGTTSYDAATTANQHALCNIAAEWSRTDASYNTRIQHLDGTLSGGLNGSDTSDVKPGEIATDL